MLDSRPAPITIAMPYTKDIPNRVISFKDIYGSAKNSTIILVTRNGDIFENSTFSTIMSNAFETMTFHAGLPNRWHRIEGTTNYGGLTTSTLNTRTISTNVAFIGTISSASVYSKFYGDGSQLTNLPNTFDGPATFTDVNVQTIANICNTSTSFIRASNISTFSISTNFAFLSNVSTNLLGANTARINTLNVTTATFDNLSVTTTTLLNTLNTGPGNTVLSNITATSMILSNFADLTISGNNLTRLIGTVSLSNTLSTNYISASNISTQSLSNTTAFFSVLSNNTQTGEGIRASNISANTISTNFISACNISTHRLSTTFGYVSNLSTSLIEMITASINTLTVNTMTASNVAITTINVTNISTDFITASNISTNSISTIFAYLSNVSTNLLGAGSAFINTLTTDSIRQSNVSTQNVSTNSFSTNVLTFVSTVGGGIRASNISVNTISTNFIASCNISTYNLSTSFAYLSNVSTNLLGADSARINTLTAGATVLTTLGVPATGDATLASLSVQGTTVLQTLNVGGAFTANSNFNVIGNFATTLGGTLSLSNTLSTNFITAANISTNSISTNNAYLSNLSNITLNGRAGNFSNLSIYDGATTSTGTFRFSTLTGLVTPQTVNLLYFNNFVFAGTNVWPGQTITALNWDMSCNGTTLEVALANPTFGETSNISNYYIASNITGGSGPYFIENIGVNQLTTFGLGIGLGIIFNGAPFGTIFGQMSNYNSSPYTFEFTLSDSSYPVALNRYISLIIQVTVADQIGNGGGVSSDSGAGSGPE
jgi:hypothetical protein